MQAFPVTTPASMVQPGYEVAAAHVTTLDPPVLLAPPADVLPPDWLVVPPEEEDPPLA
ncbi:MAG: hypothetical protein ABSF35_09640 [Polyangia bacterium]